MSRVNPYRFNIALSEDDLAVFVGRESILDSLRSFLAQPGAGISSIFGLRRTGKTSLLKRIKAELRDDVPVAFVDLVRYTDAVCSFRTLADSIVGDFNYSLHVHRWSATDSLNTFVQHLRDIQREYGTSAPVLLVDELEGISHFREGSLTAGDLYAFLTHPDNPIRSIVSFGRPLEDLPHAINAILKNTAPHRVGRLQPDEADTLIMQPLDGWLSWTADARQRLHALSGDHPLMLQHLLHGIVNAVLVGMLKTSVIDRTHVEHVEALIRSDLSSSMQWVLLGTDLRKTVLLYAVARVSGQGRAALNVILGALREFTAPAGEDAYALWMHHHVPLVESGFLEGSDTDGWAIPVELFSRYLRRKSLDEMLKVTWNRYTQPLMQKADRADQEGRYQESIQLYQDVITANPYRREAFRAKERLVMRMAHQVGTLTPPASIRDVSDHAGSDPLVRSVGTDLQDASTLQLGGREGDDAALGNAQTRLEDLVRGGATRTKIFEAGLEVAALRSVSRKGGQLQSGDLMSGEYRLMERLGSGGLTTTWRAYDRTGDQVVALKIVHPQYVNDFQVRQRLFASIQTVAFLNDPGFARILRRPEEDEGFYYYVLEFVEGGSLQQAVRESRFASDRLLQILSEAGTALEHAHQHKLLHLNLKPSNLLLTPSGHLRLTDFQLRGPAGGMGIYVAPELLPEEPSGDERSDVYGLGMLALFVLYGAELPLSAFRSPVDFVLQLQCAPLLQEVIRRAVQFERELRFDSIGDLATALREASGSRLSEFRQHSLQGVPEAQPPQAYAEVQVETILDSDALLGDYLLRNTATVQAVTRVLLVQGRQQPGHLLTLRRLFQQAMDDSAVTPDVREQLLLDLLPVLERSEVVRLLADEKTGDRLTPSTGLKLLLLTSEQFLSHPDERVWWQSAQRLEAQLVRRSRELLPEFGALVFHALAPARYNIFDRLHFLRSMESEGVFVAGMVCDILSQELRRDEVLRRCFAACGRLLGAFGGLAISRELRAMRDLLIEFADELPQADAERRLYDDLLDTFLYDDYDQFSRFLVDSYEFLPSARGVKGWRASLLHAFTEARGLLLSVVRPPLDESVAVSPLGPRIQSLSAQIEVSSEVVRRLSESAVLEERLVAAALEQWLGRILVPERQRLQDSVELMVRDLTIITDDGGLAEVVARIHNLGGRSLAGLLVGLAPGATEPYLWEGTREWYQGPLQAGQMLEYRTEILLEEGIEELPVMFELIYLEGDQEVQRLLSASSRVEKREIIISDSAADLWRIELPGTFEALCQALVEMEPGKLAVVMSEEAREGEQILAGLGAVLTDAVGHSARTLLFIDLPAMFEGPPRTEAEPIPRWWFVDRLARALLDRGLLLTLPERVEIRADPAAALEAILHRALENTGELWIGLRRATRAFISHTENTAYTAQEWLFAVVNHSSRRVKVLMASNFALMARLRIPSSPLAGAISVMDVDRPFPLSSQGSRQEFLGRLSRLLVSSRVSLSEPVRNKLIAHAGWSYSLLRRLVSRLEGVRTESWLHWEWRDGEALGEPGELEPFLRQSLPVISRSLKEQLRVLPFFHRLALAAVASGRVSIARHELREGMVLARPLSSTVKTRSKWPELVYWENAVLSEQDVRYLQASAGELQGRLEVGMFHTLDFGFSVSHLLAAVGMQRLLGDLEALGLVQHQSSSAGTHSVISSPLLRRWLVTAHPFEPGEEVNVRRRMFGEGGIAECIPLDTLVELHERLDALGQLPDFLVFLGLVDEDGRQGPRYEAAIRRWERLLALARRDVAWRTQPSAETFLALLHEWAKRFNGRVENLDHDLEEGIFALCIDLTPLRIPRLGRSVVFGLTRDLTASRAERLREIIRRVGLVTENEQALPSGAIGFILFPVLAPNATVSSSRFPIAPDREMHRSVLGERLAPLIERDLVTTTLGEDGRRAFLDLLVMRGFRFQNLSPYQLLGPLTGRTMDILFVGREDEIDDMLRHPDRQFSLVGSRKIGKTSLLLKLKQELSLHLGEKARVLYIDCATLTPAQTWRAITDGLNLAPVDVEEARLGVRRQLETLKHPVVLLLDEIDGLYDGGPQAEEAAERFMWDLRSLAAAGVVRLIFAGYVRTYERRLDPRSAFHNFTTFRKLSALTPEAARTLMRGPMSSLDIEFASEGLVDLVLDRTYRVPWIIQLFCHQLIMRLDERLAGSKRLDRRILREDVDGVSVQIEEELYTHFTSPRVMSTGEQILLLTMVEAGIHSFNEEALRERLEARFGEDIWLAVRYEDVPRALDNLTLTLALTVEGGIYSFPLDMYPTVVRSRLGDVRPRLQRLYEKLRRESV